MPALSESCAGIQLCSAASRRHLDLKQIRRIRIPSLSNSDLAGIQGIYPDNTNKSNSNMALTRHVKGDVCVTDAFIYSSWTNHEPPLLSEIPPTSAPVTLSLMLSAFWLWVAHIETWFISLTAHKLDLSVPLDNICPRKQTSGLVPHYSTSEIQILRLCNCQWP